MSVFVINLKKPQGRLILVYNIPLTYMRKQLAIGENTTLDLIPEQALLVLVKHFYHLDQLMPRRRETRAKFCTIVEPTVLY